MKYRFVFLMLSLFLAVVPARGHALTIDVSYPPNPCIAGSFFDIFVDVSVIDPSDGVLGFDFFVNTDSGVQFLGATMGPGVDEFPFSFGDVAGFAAIPPLYDDGRLLTLHFKALQAGMWEIALNGSGADFMGLATEANFFDIDFLRTVEVTGNGGGTVIPEPATFAFVGMGLLCGAMAARRLKNC